MESAPKQEKAKSMVEDVNEKLTELNTRSFNIGQDILTLVESINYSERTKENPNWQKVAQLVKQYKSVKENLDHSLNQIITPE